jgi:hypothetical protein
MYKDYALWDKDTHVLLGYYDGREEAEMERNQLIDDYGGRYEITVVLETSYGEVIEDAPSYLQGY